MRFVVAKLRMNGNVMLWWEKGVEKTVWRTEAIGGSVRYQHLESYLMTDVVYRRFRTGVRSRSSSASVADVAASMRSSHRFPSAEAALCGSAEKAFLPSILILLACSLDLVLSCLGFRAFCVIDDLRGRAGLSLRWMGGNVDDLSGGDLAIIEGSSSRGLEGWNGCRICWLRWFRMDGSSIEDRICSVLASRSDIISCECLSSA